MPAICFQKARPTIGQGTDAARSIVGAGEAELPVAVARLLGLKNASAQLRALVLAQADQLQQRGQLRMVAGGYKPAE